MRVLWFVNVVLPEAADGLNLPLCHKAGWLEGYIAAIRTSGKIELTVVTRSEAVNQTREIVVEGVQYIILPSTGVDITGPLTPEVVKEYCAVIQSVSPDLIHFHGSEYHYGLLQAGNCLNVPAVLSIQGLMSECARVYFGGLSLREIFSAHTLGEIRYRSGIWGGWRQFGRRARVENTIIMGMQHVIGRTRWDRAHVKAINSKVTYYYCDELLRPVFYRTERERENIQKFSIFTPSASYPLKGFHILLKAVALLKEEFPGITIHLADSQSIHVKASGGYYRFLHKMIVDLQLTDCIEWIGPQDGAGMAKALATAHVFSLPSLIENSSNSLAEAMLVGVPSTVSLAGGLTSRVKDLSTALCFPAGDHVLLAECIRMLFMDDDLAQGLARNAQEVARKRHDYAVVSNDLLSIYQAIITGKNLPFAAGAD